MKKKTIISISFVILVLLLLLFLLTKDYFIKSPKIPKPRIQIDTESEKYCTSSDDCEEDYSCIGIQGLDQKVCEKKDVAKEYQIILNRLDRAEKLTVKEKN